MTNQSTVPLTNLSVTDDLPAGIVYVGGTTGGTCGTAEPTSAGQRLTWTVPTLDADESCTITFQARRVGEECAGLVRNMSEVIASFQSPCINSGQAITVSDTSGFNLTCIDAPCVTLDLVCDPARACASAPVALRWTARNCSSDPATITVVIDGQTFGPYADVPAGESVSDVKQAVMPASCPPGRQVPFSGTATADNGCAPAATANATCEVQCTTPPSVRLDLICDPARACASGPVALRWTATNTGVDTSTISVTIDGQVYGPFANVAPGGSVSDVKQAVMPAECPPSGNVPFSGTATADNGCVPVATSNAQCEVQCIAPPSVRLDLVCDPARACASGPVALRWTATNTGADTSTISVTIDGQTFGPFANVAPGGSVSDVKNAVMPAQCPPGGNVPFSGTASADNGCVPVATSNAQCEVQCITPPSVRLDLVCDPARACASGPVALRWTATNTGADTSTISVTIDGQTFGPFANVAPGGSVSDVKNAVMPVECPPGGLVPFSGTATADNGCVPVATSNAQCEVQCIRPPSVRLDLICDPARACANGPVALRWTATNTGADTSTITVTVDGQTFGPFANVAPGGSVSDVKNAVMPAECPPGGNVPFSGTASADNGCVPVATSNAQCEVQCIAPPSVRLDLVCDPARACAGGPVALRWTATNTGTDTSTISVTIDGQTFGPFANVAPGGSVSDVKNAVMPAQCPPGGNVPFSGTATADNGCVPVATSNAQCEVQCIAPPSVRLDLVCDPARACASGPVALRWTATNTGADTSTISVTIDGQTFGPFANVAPGGSVSDVKNAVMPASCPTGGSVPFTGTATADNGCVPVATSNAQCEVQCTTPPSVRLDLICDPARACASGPVALRWTATNTGTDTSTISVTIDGQTFGPFANVAPGGSVSDVKNAVMPAECPPGGNVPFSGTASADNGCVPVATSNAQCEVQCTTPPSVRLDLICDPARACASGPVALRWTATNTGADTSTISVTIDGQTFGPFANVAPGGSVSDVKNAVMPASCPTSGLVPFSGTASADNGCVPVATSNAQCEVQCIAPPSVRLDLVCDPARACASGPVALRWTATNTGADTSTISVTIDGQTFGPFANVAPGGSVSDVKNAVMPANCPPGGNVPFSGVATADNGCVPVATSNAQCEVQCITPPSVRLDLVCDPARACTSAPVALRWTATNTGADTSTISVTIDGQTFGPFTNVAPGGSVSDVKNAVMPAECPPGGNVPFSGTATADNGCAPPTTASAACEVACLPGPCVQFSLVGSPEAQCVGGPVTLRWTVTNCSTETEDIAVRLGSRTLPAFSLPAGESRSDTIIVPMLVCDESGHVTFSGEATATGACTPGVTASSSFDVECQTPRVEIVNTATPEVQAGGTVHYVLTVRNPSSAVPLENVVVTDALCSNTNSPRNFSGTCEGATSPTVSGSQLIWPAFDLAPGASCRIEFDATMLQCEACTNEATVVGFCADARATASDTSRTICECPEPCVQFSLQCSPEAQCVGGPVTLRWTVTNCSTASEDIVVRLGGRTLPAFTLPAGQTRSDTIIVPMPKCGEDDDAALGVKDGYATFGGGDGEGGGHITFKGEATATGCATSVNAKASCDVTCGLAPCVKFSLECSPEAQCVGGPVTLRWTVKNCGTESEDVVVRLGGRTLPAFSLPAGETRSDTIIVPMPKCGEDDDVALGVRGGDATLGGDHGGDDGEGGGHVTFKGEAKVTGACGQGVRAKSSCEVKCGPSPCVKFSLQCSPEAQCVGGPVTLRWTVKNCGTESEDIVVRLGYRTLPAFSLPAGQTRSDTIIVPMPKCGEDDDAALGVRDGNATLGGDHGGDDGEGGGHVAFKGQATATSACGPGAVTAKGSCEVKCGPSPCVKFSLQCSPEAQCAGGPVTLRWTVKNCGTESEDVVVRLGYRTLPAFSLPAGQTRSDTIIVPMPKCGEDDDAALGVRDGNATLGGDHGGDDGEGGGHVTFKGQATATSACGPGAVTAKSSCEVKCGPSPCVKFSLKCSPEAQNIGGPVTLRWTVKNCGTESENVVVRLGYRTLPAFSLPAGQTRSDTIIVPMPKCGGDDDASWSVRDGNATLGGDHGGDDREGGHVTFKGQATATGACGPGAVTAKSSCEVECQKRDQPGLCWLTGGGESYDSKGHLHSYGGVINPSCSPAASDGGNWNDRDHTTGAHFKGLKITVVRCGNVPGIPTGSESPKTPFNFIEFRGTGTITDVSGKKKAVSFNGYYEDRSEPGSQGQSDGEKKDRYFLRVFTNSNDPTGSTVMLVDRDGKSATQDPTKIFHGNLQIHISGCDKPVAQGIYREPETQVGLEELETMLPGEVSFGAARPNPTLSMAEIRYGLPEATEVSGKVFDVAGRMVRDLGEGPVAAGWHSITWDLRDQSGVRVGAGMYFIRVMVAGKPFMRPVTVLK